MDQETREAVEQLGRDLRGEIQSSAAETRAYVDERLQASAADTRAYVDERIQASAVDTRAYMDERFRASTVDTRAYMDNSVADLRHDIRESEARMRRHFDVVAESLRGDIRAIAEVLAMSNEERDRRLAGHTERTDGLEGRVLRLEARVSTLEDGRKARRRRRR